MNHKGEHPTVLIAVLNWNGRRYFDRLIPGLLAAADSYQGPCNVVVLDNQSSEDDLNWIQEHYPQIELVVSPTNDYLFSYNWFLEQREEQIAILLNNDLHVDIDFIEPLVRHFSDPDVFAVNSKSFDWDGTEITSGPVEFQCHRGWYFWRFKKDQQLLSYTFFASGGHSAFDRLKFVELGGFDRLFYPAYGEDVDLSFRAWCKGWKCLYEPESIVYHAERSSWESVKDSNAADLVLRAQFLFHWRNLRIFSFYPTHLAYLLRTYCASAIGRHRHWLINFNIARKIWSIRRRAALARKPEQVDLQTLETMCGTVVKVNVDTHST